MNKTHQELKERLLYGQVKWAGTISSGEEPTRKIRTIPFNLLHIFITQAMNVVKKKSKVIPAEINLNYKIYHQPDTNVCAFTSFHFSSNIHIFKQKWVHILMLFCNLAFFFLLNHDHCHVNNYYMSMSCKELTEYAII